MATFETEKAISPIAAMVRFWMAAERKAFHFKMSKLKHSIGKLKRKRLKRTRIFSPVVKTITAHNSKNAAEETLRETLGAYLHFHLGSSYLLSSGDPAFR